jgi:cell division protein FtsL
MTIINPSAARNLRFFISLIIFIAIIGGLIYIREYNSFVDTRDELKKLKALLVELQAKNADLKNELYLTTEPTKLEEIARKRGLTVERRPEYLSLGKWLSDFSR